MRDGNMAAFVRERILQVIQITHIFIKFPFLLVYVN